LNSPSRRFTARVLYDLHGQEYGQLKVFPCVPISLGQSSIEFLCAISR
jgi:hypothetical protein